jgi:hypothetical protein
MKPILTLAISLFAGGFALAGLTVAQGGEEGSTGDELREVIVSHTDENGILQLYRMKEDGSGPPSLPIPSAAAACLPALRMGEKWFTLDRRIVACPSGFRISIAKTSSLLSMKE